MLSVPLEYKNMGLPALVFIWCLFPYLFGAQASLTMFSNLVTEKERSNHLIIDTRYTKIWDFEKDLVFVEDIPTTYRPPSRYDLQGYLIPLSEFKFIASVTTQDPEREVSIKGKVNEEQIWIEDLAHSEFANAPLVSRFMSFRQIDPIGSAKCRW